MKIAILGFDREGKSTLRFIKRLPQFKHAEIWIVDKKSTIKIPPGTHGMLGAGYLKKLSSFDLIFRTPGIPWMKPELVKSRRAGVKFSSATKLFFDEAARKNVHIIGITGTKGKGTTATLLHNMMRAGHKRAFLAGNIGIPMLELLPKLKRNDTIILELSSFQLQDLESSPHTAVVLDIFPDHQDSHLNLKEYYDAKTNIARHQKKGDRIFFFKNHPLSRWAAAKSRGRKIAIDEKQFGLFDSKDLKMPGYHNFKNAVMAAAVARAMGVPVQAIIRAAKAFRGNEHRLEFVKRLRLHNTNLRIRTNDTNEIHSQHSHTFADSHYIDFYNDSASTIPQATAAAVLAFPEHDVILVAGGRSKVKDYSSLINALRKARVPLVVLYGENKNEIAKAISRFTIQDSRFKNNRIKIIFTKTLARASEKAYRFAKSLVMSHKSSVIILFSPASQSFDQFKNYADRGEQFKKLVRSLVLSK